MNVSWTVDTLLSFGDSSSLITPLPLEAMNPNPAVGHRGDAIFARKNNPQ